MVEKGTAVEVPLFYLKFFKSAPDLKTRTCIFCEQSYPLHTVLWNLRTHLETNHPGYDRMGDAVCSVQPPPITMVSVKGDKTGEDDTARPSPQPITAGTETADEKKGVAVPMSLQHTITNSVNKTANKMDMEPKNMARKGTVAEVTLFYLKFFETAPDWKTRSCKLCNQSYPIETVLGNLGRHLEMNHPGFDKMDDVVSSLPPQAITTVSEKGDRMGDATARPSPQPITIGTVTAGKKGVAVPMSLQHTIAKRCICPHVNKTADMMTNAISSPLPQLNTTASKGADNMDMKPKNMAKKGTVAEVTLFYLKFFETAPDWKTRCCKLCYQTYPIETVLGNLGRHLEINHPGYDKMADAVSSLRRQPITMVSVRGEKTGDDTARPCPRPVSSATVTADEKGLVVPMSSLQTITSNAVKTTDMMSNGVSSPLFYLGFFETAPDWKTRSCKFCYQNYPIETVIGNLGRHLEINHPGYDKMGYVVSSPRPHPITMVSVRVDKTGDDAARPSPQPITAGTDQTADEKGAAVPVSSLQTITSTVTKTTDMMSNAMSSPLFYLGFFETAPDWKTRSCKFCHQSYPIETVLGNLGRHLEINHPGYDKMGDVVSSLRPQPIAMVSEGDDDTARPSPQPVAAGTEISGKKGVSVPMSSLHTSTVNRTSDMISNATSSSKLHSNRTVRKSRDKIDREPKNLSKKRTLDELALFYLKFFETAPDWKSRSCKLCYESYPIETVLGNLGRHLEMNHPGYDKMGNLVSSQRPQPITTGSESGDRIGDDTARPSPQPITVGAETAGKNDVAVPMSSLLAITSTATKTSDMMSNAISSPLPQLNTTVAKSPDKMGELISSPSQQAMTTASKRAQSNKKSSKNMELKNMTEIVTGTEVASLYLKFFETAPDWKSRSCKFCNQSYPIATAYGNLGRHLKYRHPEYVNMGDTIPSPSPLPITTVMETTEENGDAVPRPSPLPITTVMETAEENGDAVPRPSPLPITSATEVVGRKGDAVPRHLKHCYPGEYDKMLGVISNSSAQPITTASKTSTVDLDHLNWMLMGGSFTPSALQDKWLSNSFKFLNPISKSWSNESLQAVIQEVFRSMQEDLKASLKLVNSKISLSLEFWTSYEQIFYMSITGHWIDESWSLHKVLLDISRLPYAYSGTDIYNTIVKVLEIYNIENKILSCTHDNSQNAIHACQTLKKYLDGRNSMAFCYIPCAARTLNLIIEDGLRTTEPVISKVREFVLKLNTSPVVASDFEQTTSAYEEGSWSFPIDTSTRWSGNYAMLDIARKASKSMGAVIRKHEASLASNNMLLNLEEKVAVSITHLYLEPLHNTINNICASKVPTVGLVLYFMDGVYKMVAACKGSCHAPAWLKSCAEDMEKKCRIYNDQVHNIYTYMAAILDPRIKGELIPKSLKLESNLKEARDHFMRNYSTNHFPAPANGYSPQETQENQDEGNWKRRRIDMPTSTDELSQYLSEDPSPITTDILNWWKENSYRYPRLSVMARDFLAVQSSSVSPDELFSGKGDEVDNRRLCLPYESTQPVLCIRAWIESGFKLKYRSAEVDFEKLMESVISCDTTTTSATPTYM